MKRGTLRILIGILFVILQLGSVFGTLGIGIDIWDAKTPTAAQAVSPSQTAVPNLLLTGFYVGHTKYVATFRELPELLTNPDFLHEPTALEQRSSGIRTALDKDPDVLAPLQAALYDATLFTGYAFAGLLGLCLLFTGIGAKIVQTNPPQDFYLDKPRPVGGLLLLIGCFFCILAYFLFNLRGLMSGTLAYPLLILSSYGIMILFFAFRFSKKYSALPIFAMLLFGAMLILTSLGAIITGGSGPVAVDVINILANLLFRLPAGVLMLIAAITLFYTYRKALPRVLMIVAACLYAGYFLVQTLFYIVSLAAKVTPSLPSFDLLGFMLILTVYLCFPSLPVVQKKAKKSRKAAKKLAAKPAPQPIVETPCVAPVVEPVVEPEVEAVVESIVEPEVEPIEETVVEPVVEAEVEPIVE